MSKSDDTAKCVNPYISKGAYLLLVGSFLGILFFMPRVAHEFIAQTFGKVTSHAVYILIELIPPSFILYGLIYLRKINRYLQTAFWLRILHILLRIIVVVIEFSLFSFEQSENIISISLYIIAIVASFTLYWGIALIFASSAPKLSKGFKGLFFVGILAPITPIMLGATLRVTPTIGAAMLVGVLFLYTVCEIFMFGMAYKQLRKS